MGWKHIHVFFIQKKCWIFEFRVKCFSNFVHSVTSKGVRRLISTAYENNSFTWNFPYTFLQNRTFLTFLRKTIIRLAAIPSFRSIEICHWPLQITDPRSRWNATRATVSPARSRARRNTANRPRRTLRPANTSIPGCRAIAPRTTCPYAASTATPIQTRVWPSKSNTIPL